MTTTVTKESLAARIADLEYGPRSLKEDYTLAAYKMLLATMEAEPVAYIPESQLNLLERAVMVDADLSKVQRFDEIPLYRHAQPVVQELDEREAFEAFMEGRFGDTVDRRRAKNGDQGYMAWDMAMAWVVWEARAQPVLVVPDEMTADGIIDMHECGYVEGWNACRAAMLNQK